MSDPDITAEQVLDVESFVAVMEQAVPDPPHMHLTMNVAHTETGHQWVLGAIFSREQTIELTRLLVHVCDYHGLDWRQ